ncbi:DNA-binding CsgD family transcriptional regulator [Streptomyces africanus]|uniref:DNA-binding CsgD family transcriptional regulator n=1 Tax=Streptomyces africanus TaxID=231024 RepID=A0ABU0R2W3_9ACTN|nr:LuxR family transcriptional regulator [Streptomyces africanus]MDQ0753998.1 DNA-binding CsgD family transcriptional regulator [Streptomyces africanus]
MEPSDHEQDTDVGPRPARPGEAGGAGVESRLLEREDELRRIGAAIAGARAGRGTVLVLEGAAGVGKTRLLRAATELAAESDMAVVSARSGQLETEFAFGVARQLFETVLTAAEAGEREVLLEGAAAPAAWLLGGGRADRLGEPVGGGDRSFAALHGLYGLTAKLAARAPLLMVVDDAHWADVPSLRFLGYLARRVHGLPVLLMVAVRPEDPGAHGLLLTELVAGPEVDVVRPGPFTLDAVQTLLQDAFAAAPLDPRFVRGCRTTTGGNPFLLTQLIAALHARGAQPTSAAVEQVGEMGLETVSRWINLRLAGLPPSATALAAAVAVLGDGADVVQAARLAGLDPGSCDDAVDGLVSMSILRGADGLAFVHPLVRWAIYARLPPRRRARGHRDAARLLWHEGSAVERVASHLLAAAPTGDAEVVEILLDAARSATRKGAPDLAVRYLKRALAEPAHDMSRPELLRELGAAEQSAGQFTAAAEDLRAALECTDNIAAKIEIGFRLRTALVWSDRAHEVAPALDGLIADATERDSEGALLLEAAVAGALQVDLSTPRGLRDRVRQVVAPAFAGEPVPPHISSLAAVEALFANEPAARVLRLAEEAARGRYQVPAFARAPMSAQIFVALIFAEGHSLARRLLDDEVEDARRHGSAAQFLNAAVLRSMLFHRLGMLAEADADARAALEAAHLHPGTGPTGSGPPAHSLHAPIAVAVLVDTLIERGKIGDAERLLTETGLADADSPLLLFSFLIGTRARLRATQGRTAEAIDQLLALGSRLEGAVVTPGIVPWRSQAALALAAADAGAAHRLACEELELARVFGAPRTLGVALRAAALTASPNERVDLLREAVAVLEDPPARLEHARSLVELGAVLRREGRRAEARTALERGMDGAWSCGATALAQRAREELHAIGARPRRQALSGVDALTGAERRVADLADQSLTNRQIAEALAISLPTVETHLRHVFQKLGIRSRRQLAEHLGGSHKPAAP